MRRSSSSTSAKIASALENKSWAACVFGVATSWTSGVPRFAFAGQNGNAVLVRDTDFSRRNGLRTCATVFAPLERHLGIAPILGPGFERKGSSKEDRSFPGRIAGRSWFPGNHRARTAKDFFFRRKTAYNSHIQQYRIKDTNRVRRGI